MSGALAELFDADHLRPLRHLAVAFDRVDRNRRRLFTETDAIKADKNLSAAQKEIRLKVKEQEELALMEDARKQLEAARAKASGPRAPRALVPQP